MKRLRSWVGWCGVLGLIVAGGCAPAAHAFRCGQVGGRYVCPPPLPHTEYAGCPVEVGCACPAAGRLARPTDFLGQAAWRPTSGCRAAPRFLCHSCCRKRATHFVVSCRKQLVTVADTAFSPPRGEPGWRVVGGLPRLGATAGSRMRGRARRWYAAIPGRRTRAALGWRLPPSARTKRQAWRARTRFVYRSSS